MKRMYALFCLIFILGGYSFSQTYVAPGEGTLSQAITDAVDGDVLQLVAGGVYTESVKFEFGTIVNKNLTIEVDGDGTDKAIVQMKTVPTVDNTTVFFEVGDQASLTLRGIEFDGSVSGNPSATNLVTFYMGETAAAAFVKKIRVENCYIHDLLSFVISASNSTMKSNVVVDSTFLDNVFVRRTGTSVYYKYAGANYVSVKNSTFDTISSYGFRICGPIESGSPNNTPTVDIDHTTWYNIGSAVDGREIILGEKGPLLNPWTVTNSILVKQYSKVKIVINIKETTGDSLATISNICLWDIGVINFRSHSVKDTITMNPEFADPANGDFTLPVGSPLLTFGTDGKPIGDPRWGTNYVGIQREAGTTPDVFALNQNYPNPFNPTTMISFHLGQAGFATLAVFDLSGREVAWIVSKNLPTGDYQFSFDGGHLSSGIYIYRLTSGGSTLSRKMMLIR